MLGVIVLLRLDCDWNDLILIKLIELIYISYARYFSLYFITG